MQSKFPWIFNTQIPMHTHISSLSPSPSLSLSLSPTLSSSLSLSSLLAGSCVWMHLPIPSSYKRSIGWADLTHLTSGNSRILHRSVVGNSGNGWHNALTCWKSPFFFVFIGGIMESANGQTQCNLAVTRKRPSGPAEPNEHSAHHFRTKPTCLAPCWQRIHSFF